LRGAYAFADSAVPAAPQGFPDRATMAGTSRQRTTTASTRIPAPSPVARILRSVSGPVDMERKLSIKMAAAVGVRGRRITAYRPDGTVIGSANCGAGPTRAVTGDSDLYWIVDTNGGAVLAFRVGAHGPRQMSAITPSETNRTVAYDNHRSTLWVTLTGSDELLGLHLRGTTVTSRTTYATVQQPNTVAVDNLTGELVVTGSTQQGALQLINDSGAPRSP